MNKLPQIGFDTPINLTRPHDSTYYKQVVMQSVYYKDRIYFFSIRNVPKPSDTYQNNVLPQSLIQIVNHTSQAFESRVYNVMSGKRILKSGQNLVSCE